MTGESARSILNFPVELWQDLVLHGIEKSTFQDFPANWNLNVIEMALKTLHIVQGLSRTPLLFIPRYVTNIFPDFFELKQEISKIMLVRYRGINDKGVLERPLTIWTVLDAISSTLKFQFAVKC